MNYTANTNLRRYLTEQGFNLIQNGTVDTLYFTNLKMKSQIKIDRFRSLIVLLDSSGKTLREVKAISKTDLDKFIKGAN